MKLTHLSLTGVQAFLRADLEAFCREAPAEFTEHQRNVFCVFSGRGVIDLRRHLNSLQEPFRHPSEDDFGPLMPEADEDQVMNGMLGATVLNGDDEDADGDEEFEAEVPEN